METNKRLDRNQAIEKLVTAINDEHRSSLTFEQVSNWLGEDATVKDIETHIFEIEIISYEAVQPIDILKSESNILN
ncbi:hypothetical protein [Pseudoalteromonas sp. 2CM36K]|uniref:hypothetical protein n=1 Tax=Pseudoalteromonas sp. 2CM36K TaxID=2929854 RepID=UPI0020BEABB3|nr:hypothetical protein [Pseudoalteromonas sp. 2CM36K]MCK8103117.1 hypothetical protein [Pseudoalteromonas sp. 2CM36K]